MKIEMMNKGHYIIKEKTAGILNSYNPDGELGSIVIETGNVYRINESPLSIIQRSIEYYGGCLQGAISGAKRLIGNVSMTPVQIRLGLYWFPSKSIKHEDHIWIAVDHIDRTIVQSNKMLRVYLKNGYPFDLNISNRRFKGKYNNALRLKNISLIRHNGHSYYYDASNFGHQIVMDPDRNHYVINLEELNLKGSCEGIQQ